MSPFKIPKGVPGTSKESPAPEPGPASSYRSYADTTKQMNVERAKRAKIDRGKVSKNYGNINRTIIMTFNFFTDPPKESHERCGRG